MACQDKLPQMPQHILWQDISGTKRAGKFEKGYSRLIVIMAFIDALGLIYSLGIQSDDIVICLSSDLNM